jgi:hypothetical protein
LTLCDVNFRAPKDKAAARVEEVEPEVEPDWEEWPSLEGWRLS